MNKYKLAHFMGEKNIVDGVIVIDNSMIPNDVLILSDILGDAASFKNKKKVLALKTEIEYSDWDLSQTNTMFIEKKRNMVVIGSDIIDDAEELVIPKSDFLRLLDELATAIDTDKDIWIEKSDEGKYRIWGE